MIITSNMGNQLKLIPIGVYMVFPFLTLQALGLGLTYADISIVYGLSPVLCLGAQPLAGRELSIQISESYNKQIYFQVLLVTKLDSGWY